MICIKSTKFPVPIFICCILLLGLTVYGSIILHNSATPVDKTDILISKSETQSTQPVSYEYKQIDITDSKLAYYGLKKSELLEEKHISSKPDIQTDDNGRITSLTMSVDSDTIKQWNTDTEQNPDSKAFTQRYLTGKDFIENQDAVFVTDYTYDNVIKPCKQEIKNYILTTNESVLYHVILEYDNDQGTQCCPKWINIRACTPADDGQTFDFSLYALNCDKNKIVDRNTLDWDIMSKE